mmetsp:Transcript_41721/g.90958  ORF Transcript_41721/g.90958 Transcript_41721/m.90958 type:complete len:83 (+) Transcript_41721:573-821(+)
MDSAFYTWAEKAPFDEKETQPAPSNELPRRVKLVKFGAKSSCDVLLLEAANAALEIPGCLVSQNHLNAQAVAKLLSGLRWLP